MIRQTKKRDKLKAPSRQRWPKSERKGIKLIKQTEERSEDSPANGLMDFIAKRDVEKVKETLDKLWRKNIQTGKDIDTIKAAQKFLREVDSNNS